jgi:uncharacterized protein (DUF58 family)
VSKSLVELLGRIRTPAEPGPGSVSTAGLEALDLAIGRRVDALLSGEYRSTVAGFGTEFHQVRPYTPGDDVRKIDWNVMARTGQPYVRVELAERVLVTWLVVDLSASMAFGTADRRKTDVAEGVSIAIGHVATRRGNRLGVVAFGDGRPTFHRPIPGRHGLLSALRSLRVAPAGNGGLGEALSYLDGLAVQRSLVVVVSDFRDESDWNQVLARIATRHPTLAVEIRDPREQELANVGELHLEDPETGEHLVVDTHDRVLRERFAAAAVEDRRALVAKLASIGVPHVALSTEGDWLLPLAGFLARSGRT